MYDVHQLFEWAMDRQLPYLIETREDGVELNLGAGNKPIPNAVDLDLPEWDANKDQIPFGSGTVDVIHAYHFLEHVDNPIAMLRECERVLVTGGVLNICVPYYRSNMAYHDLTHKHYFTEATWANILHQPYYDRGKWSLEINLNVIIGIVERNLALLTQLVKT